MPKARELWTNFTKGELSPRVEGRPDLDLYYAGASKIENFYLLRTGGLTRRPGTRFIAEVKDSTMDTILLPLEVNSERAFVIEMGQSYARFYKDKAPIKSSGVPVEIVTPYNAANLRYLHFTASVDVLFLFHQNYRQRRLSHVDDTTWNLYEIVPQPPPTYNADFDINDDIPGNGVGIQGDLSGSGPADPPGGGWIDPTLLPGGGGLSQGNSGGGGD